MIESVFRGSAGSTMLLRPLKTIILLALISLPLAAPQISHATEQPAQVTETESESDDALLGQCCVDFNH